jgi:diguanylate cyclase (GGDEF)-like protein/PAS domain S-box-containing protein
MRLPVAVLAGVALGRVAAQVLAADLGQEAAAATRAAEATKAEAAVTSRAAEATKAEAAVTRAAAVGEATGAIRMRVRRLADPRIAMDPARNPDHAAPLSGGETLDEPLLAPAAILEGLPDAVVAAARDGRIVFANALAEELFGYPREELLGKPVEMLWPERVRDRYVRNMELYFENEHPLRFSTEARGVRRDGSEFVGEMSWGIVNTTAGPLLLAIGRDISDRRAAEARLRAVAAMGERALAGGDPADLASEAVELLKASLPLAGVAVKLENGGVLASAGRDPKVAIRLPIGTGDDLLLEPKRELAADEISIARAVANILTTAIARAREDERIRYDAVHDPLTGLANRILLRDRLEHALARSKREGDETGVLFVDLDNFKDVNDTYGHAAGDEVLVKLSGRLQSAVRPADTIARLGGDEFVAVCEKVDEESALALARRLQETIELPVVVEGIEHGLSASIGIALGNADPEALLVHADEAVYRAKADGRGQIALFH